MANQINYLVDTNVWLELLLDQEQTEKQTITEKETR